MPRDSAAPAGGRRRHYRWVVCALLFFATTVNYVDRQILALIKEFLDAELGWSNETFGWVNGAFQLAYAVGLLRLRLVRRPLRDEDRLRRLDRRCGASPRSATRSWARSNGFFAARVALGVSEGGNFPSAIKAVALWFPKRERAFATSIFNAGTNVGAIIAPAMIPAIAINFGWRWAFILAGLAGLRLALLLVPDVRRAREAEGPDAGASTTSSTATRTRAAPAAGRWADDPRPAAAARPGPSSSRSS